MRPLRLQVENVAAFRGKHLPLDFSPFELFAITGPTGAGKSSLLDAIVFALYGRVPRLGKGVSEMIALGRDRMAVSLDFRIGGREFRVARALHRGRKGKASEAALEELLADREKPIADGVAAVNKALERILGLGYDAFTQAVILPQGEFQRFLKSEPAQRRAILSDLLRLQVYKRMYDRAAGEASRLGAFLQGQQAVIDGESEVATPEVIAETRARLEQLLAANRERREAQERRERCLLALRVRRQKTLELEEAERREETLRAREKESGGAERRLLAALQAEKLLPRIESLERARSALRSSTLRWETARRAETEATLTNEKAHRDLKAATDLAAAQLPQLAERLRELDAVSGLLVPLESARQRLTEAHERHERSDRELEAARAAEREARQRAKATQKASKTASERLAGSRYDAARHARLESHRQSALLLGQLRAALAKAEAEQASVAVEALRLDADERRASQAVAVAEQAHAEAAATLLAAEESRREAERAHAAAHLRAALREGQACPVCEQPVAVIPRPAAAADLDGPQQRLARARAAAEATQKSLLARRDELARAAAEARQLRLRAQAGTRELADAGRGLAEAESRLRAGAGEDLEARVKGALEERLAATLERLAAARVEHEARSAEHERALREDERAQQALATAAEAAAAAARVLDEHARAEQAAEREAKELRARIDAVTRGKHADAERARLEAERARLLDAQQQAQRRERDAAEALLQARLEREQAQHAMADAQTSLGAAGGELDAGLKAAGFKDAQAARAAALAPAERESLQRGVDEFKRESHAVASRLAELAGELGGERASSGQLQDAEAEVVAERQRLEDESSEAARLSERVADLQRRADRARELSETLQRDRRRQAVYQQLTTDLRSENFRAFVLEEVFHELVAGASERLMALSGRYSFAFQDDAFQVLDHDNAGERRSAETLSGGETFLASLALALELSQQIQRAAGAVHLESLFIDEGFGSLDPEALDTIAATLEDLPVGGRMVGVITHLPTLTERIPNRVWVEKRPEGSRFTVETA